MKEFATIVLATSLIFVGFAASVFCAYQVCLGQWVWLVLLAGALMVLFSGIQIARGERPGEIVRDLMFVLSGIHK